MSIHKRAERIEQLAEKLMERDDYYEALLDASPWGILVVDDEFKIVYMNEAMEDICGYELTDIEGEHLHLLIPPEDRDVHVEHEEDFKKHPRTRMGDHPFEPNVWNSEGERVAVEISLAPARVRGNMYFYASIRRRETLPPKEVNDAS